MEAKIRITKKFTFETAHVLHGYDGKCKNVHGHSYKLFVTVIGKPINDLDSPKFGMLIDFSDLKKIIKQNIINKFDHSIVLNQNTSHKTMGDKIIQYCPKVVFVPYQPTCENMVIDFSNIIKKALINFKNCQLHSLKLFETETSYSQWFASDN